MSNDTNTQAQSQQAQQQPSEGGLLNLDDDTPMACPIFQPGEDGTCEACQ